MFWFHLACLTTCLPIAGCFSVGTYNLWNVMFNWPTRKLRVVEMIHSLDVDVFVAQEVRSGRDSNQLLDLKSHLSSKYKWHIFRAANNVSFVDNSIDKTFPGEGLGLISRLPIVKSSTHFLLPNSRDPDRNKRIIVHARIQDSDNTMYDVVVVHLSYYRQQQCRNIADIIQFINRKNLKNVILLGDFNTYKDYNWPIQLLTDPIQNPSNQCWREVRNQQIKSGVRFIDAWKVVHPNEDGLTFSNMPSPGMESRPDRVLVDSNLQIETIQLLGNGSRYKRRYIGDIHWSRFFSVIQSAYMSYQNVKGYSCLHDCGPHGSCICGVCVAVGNQETCHLPDCDICNSDVFISMVKHFAIFVIILLHLCYSVIVIMTVGTSSYGDVIHSILGWKCCLFNPRLCKATTVTLRQKHTILKMCRIWPLFRLPPYLQLLIYLISLVIMYIYSRQTFSQVIDVTYNVLDEELFPSDHLFVVAKIKS